MTRRWLLSVPWRTPRIYSLDAWLDLLPTLPFRRNEDEGGEDSRRSITERYRSREEYLDFVSLAALKLVDEGFMLHADAGRSIE